MDLWFLSLSVKFTSSQHNNFIMLFLLIIAVETDSLRLKLALAIPSGAPIIVVNYDIEKLLLVADKTIKDLSK